jgi:TetR/AcrR family transcriptional regulator, regulator of mycofactocin system
VPETRVSPIPPIPHERRGRPPATSARQLEVAALKLFERHGFDGTTVEDIAHAAGVSRRTFFRYFDTKADVLWHAFDDEIRALQAALDDLPPDIPLMDGIRDAVVSVNHYTAADVPELRRRINLIGTVPALQASAAVHYDAWERTITAYAAERLNEQASSLRALAVGRATLAVCRAAYEIWVGRADADLTHYLSQAIDSMARGFTN